VGVCDVAERKSKTKKTPWGGTGVAQKKKPNKKNHAPGVGGRVTWGLRKVIVRLLEVFMVRKRHKCKAEVRHELGLAKRVSE